MIKYLLSAAFVAALATPAMAQDWTGVYVGGQLGGVNQPSHADETLVFDRDLDGAFNDSVTSGGNDIFYDYCEGEAVAATGPECVADKSDIDVGIRAGYDWQTGPWVVGVLAELSADSASDSVTGYTSTPNAYTLTRELKSVAAIRVRGGYAFGPMLAYVTAGFAKGNVDHSYYTTNTANAFSESGGGDLNGYQWGLGAERRLGDTPWTVGGEFIRTSLDDSDYTVRVTQGTASSTNAFVASPNTTGTDIQRSKDRFDFNQWRVTLGYRF